MKDSVEFTYFFNGLNKNEVKILYNHKMVADVLRSFGKNNHCLVNEYCPKENELIFYVYDDFSSQENFINILNLFKSKNATGMIVPYSKRNENIEIEKLSFLLEEIFSFSEDDVNNILNIRRCAFDFIKKNTNIKLKLFDKELFYSLRKDVELKILNPNFSITRGSLYNIGHFLELASVNVPNKRASILLNGDFPFEGIVFEGNRKFITENIENSFCEINSNLKNSFGNNYIVIDNNVVVDIITNNISIMEVIAKLAPACDCTVTEFSFGCNSPLFDSINFSNGSILNETVEGVHVGIGFPEKIHLDFILPMRLNCFFATKNLTTLDSLQ